MSQLLLFVCMANTQCCVVYFCRSSATSGSPAFTAAAATAAAAVPPAPPPFQVPSPPGQQPSATGSFQRGRCKNGWQRFHRLQSPFSLHTTSGWSSICPRCWEGWPGQSWGHPGASIDHINFCPPSGHCSTGADL